MAKTFVLVHGAWHGGWVWRFVANRLRLLGHRVFTPTLTGLGERAHLLTATVDLPLMIADILAVIETEELQEVILVGHSFGGLVIEGVADRMPERLRHLVFLDANIVQNGQCAMDTLPPALARARRASSVDGLTMPVPRNPTSVMGVGDPALVDWIERRLTPHPFNTYIQPLTLNHPVGNGVPCTYIASTAPAYPFFALVHPWVRAQDGWRFCEIAAGHDAMVTAPLDVVRLLLEA